MDLRAQLTALADDDVDAIDAVLAASGASVTALLTIAMTLANSRPALGFRIQAAVARRPEPSAAIEREHWLRAHNNACYFAIYHGTDAERRDVVERALQVARENVAIYHNAACLLCLLGEDERALAAVAEAVAHADDTTVKAIAEDADLDRIRSREEFQRIIAGRGEFEAPEWASGWTAWEIMHFRELVRTVLEDPDMSEFSAGSVSAAGREIDIIELAQRCKPQPVAEWGAIIRRYFVEALYH